MDTIYQLFLSLGGFAVLISFLVSVLKRFGVIKDGQSQKWHSLFQLAMFVLVAVVDIFGFDIDLALLDTAASQIAEIGALLLGFMGTLGIGDITYKVAKGTPLVGFSYSEDNS